MASSSHIKPGEKGKIKAKIDIRGRKGYISKSVKVFSNDPKIPFVKLELKAFINEVR
ncbi:MAG: DUF1573 domain-containing protein [Nitrospirae bacterium]|nr:DUF1573 domain-containing protein [Nitrospirota bacterium]